MLLCLVGGCASIIFSFTLYLQLALLLLIVLGICTVMSSTLTNTAMQSATPIEMRGRVLSIWILITFGLAPFGNLCAGWIAQNIGAGWTLAIAGGICAVVALILSGIQLQRSTSQPTTSKI
jgi:MFS family permease